MKTCPDCGERVYNFGCTNCNESAYIEEQEMLTDLIYGQATSDPRCHLCGDRKSKHTKSEADWRTVPGCTGSYVTEGK